MKTKIKYLMILVLASFVFAGCATHPCCKMQSDKNQTWEYKTVKLDPNNGAQLNEVSKDGWKLVSTVPGGNSDPGYAYFIFERPKQ
ncbi:MAG TPA: DUF4177 domain-containing protein [Verrucomicrobiae bacterium]